MLEQACTDACVHESSRTVANHWACGALHARLFVLASMCAGFVCACTCRKHIGALVACSPT
eukprot:4777276-Pleurochrysis_carterae.AAC.1